jgi:catechol 2,3-dioxygenase-like lactoylglutathione lyase family enzyme
MRGLMLFVAGIVVGLAMQSTLAQSENAGVSINHVGVAVPSIPDAAAFYQQKMGFKEAFRNTNPQGTVTAMYIQVSKNTFIELQQASERQPAGISHFGMEAPNINATVAFFKAHGAMASEPGAPSAFSKARLANVTDLNGVRIELAELGPESLQRKAIESWK